MSVKKMKESTMAIHAHIHHLIKVRNEIDLTIRGLREMLPQPSTVKQPIYVLRNNGGKAETVEVGHRRDSGKYVNSKR